jgi:hypothetical protein
MTNMTRYTSVRLSADEIARDVDDRRRSVG